MHDYEKVDDNIIGLTNFTTPNDFNDVVISVEPTSDRRVIDVLSLQRDETRPRHWTAFVSALPCMITTR